MRNTNVQKLSDVLKAFVNTYQHRYKLRQVQLKEVWEEVLGKGIANHTEHIYIKNNKLIVKLNSDVLKHELSFGKSKIVKMINEAMGEELIDDVIIR